MIQIKFQYIYLDYGKDSKRIKVRYIKVIPELFLAWQMVRWLSNRKTERKIQGRSLWWRVRRNAPLLLKILFFLNTKSEKSTFSRLFSYSIYVKVVITPPPCFLKICQLRTYAPSPALDPSYAPGKIIYKIKMLKIFFTQTQHCYSLKKNNIHK